MKIAAIITGQTRHFWYTLPSVYNHVIKPNNIDCFVMYNEKSNYDYVTPDNPSHYMDEKRIITDILGNSLIYISSDSLYGYNEEKYNIIKTLTKRIKNINIADYGDCNFWFYNDEKKINYLVDEWLKVSMCSDTIPDNTYDMIIRIRMDIPWLNEYILNPVYDGINIYYEHGNCNITPWAKEYLFYGECKAMKHICKYFVYDLYTSTETWRRGNEELCLVNEVQFGRMLHNYNVRYSHINKEHKAGKFYTFHNLDKSKYYNLSNAKDRLICYLDAGTAVKELLHDDIFDLYKN